MPDDALTAARIRLGEISDETRLLEDDDFRAKHDLNVEADDLRRVLAEGSHKDAEAMLRSWADRSARKNGHTADIELERAKAAIVSPIEGGGSA